MTDTPTARLVAFIGARLDDDERLAHKASPGPWIWNSYSAVFAGPLMRDYDQWDTGEHTCERHGKCAVCGDWLPAHLKRSPGLGDGCRLFDEEYEREPLVAKVPAHHGDTAIGRHAADAEHIAMHDPDRVLREVEFGRWLLAEHAERYCLEALQRYALRFDKDAGYDEAWRPV